MLAFLRWEAEEASGPHLLEDWQRCSYPMFCERMAGRLGDSTCRTGKHQDWPAESRVTAYTQPAASGERRAVLAADSDSSTDPAGALFSYCDNHGRYARPGPRPGGTDPGHQGVGR